ncbi:MAG: HAD family phosphatase [Oscillospiraceae bacterium]|nr:HAD family phosphatase [Oscillospiraceae bacterium]
MAKKIKYLLFDMDGLLTNSEQVTFEIWEDIFREHGYELTLDFYISIIGMVDTKIHGIIEEHYPGLDAKNVVYPEWDERYEKLAPAGGVPLKPGVVELLDYCDSHGLKKSVVSSNYLHWIETILTADGVFDRFDHVIHGALVKHGKPDPEPFLLSMEEFGASPEECLVLEDSNSGILSGHTAGMKVICIPDLKQPSEEARSYCSAVLPSLEDVIPWLEEYNKEECPQ